MLGEILKNKREESRLDLREIAHALRFQYDYLKALEDEDLNKLPPDVYAKAYIRGYAKFLNIDPLPLLDDFAELGRKSSGEVQVEAPQPAQPRKNPPLPKIALVASVIMVIALILVIFMYANRPAAPVHSTVSVPSEAVPSKGPQQHVLDVTATETTWLLVETREGISEEVLLRPGETRKWTSESGFDLKVGNAGGIRLVFDNNEIGTPGEKGRVVRLHLP